MEEMNIVDELKSRIVDPYPRVVDCGPGWYGLLKDLHNSLVFVDPHYTLIQVKEKFGGLRFYVLASEPEMERLVFTLVSLYERISFKVCEMTGEPGMLMVKDGVYKTLAESFKDSGWQPAFVRSEAIEPVWGDSERV